MTEDMGNAEIMRMVQCSMGVSLLEHCRYEKILEETTMERIAMIMRRLE